MKKLLTKILIVALLFASPLLRLTLEVPVAQATSIAVDNEAYLGFFGTVTGFTVAYTNTNASLLVVGIFSQNSGGPDLVTAVTYNGASMTRLDKGQQGNLSTSSWIDFWYLVGPTSGTHNIVSTITTGAINVDAVAASYTGSTLTGFPDAHLTTIPTGNVTSVANTFNSVADNSWHIMVGSGDNNFPTAGTNTTRRIVSSNVGMAIFDSNAAIHPAGSTTLNMTTASGHAIVIGATFAPSTGAAINAIFFSGD